MTDFDYWYWEKILDKNEIVSINNFIDNNFDCFEDIKDKPKDTQGNPKKNSQVKKISLNKLNNLILPTLEQAYATAFVKFGYNLYPRNINNSFLLNTYSETNQSKFDYHIDSSRSNTFDVKLTFIINLSLQEFQGGKFMIFNGSEYEIEGFVKPGSAILFKSYLSHKVTPIIKGERKTLSYFMYGPKFI